MNVGKVTLVRSMPSLNCEIMCKIIDRCPSSTSDDPFSLSFNSSQSLTSESLPEDPI